jgi:hypothetical protein
MRSLVVGTGSYAPEKVLTNADLEAMVDTTDAWIQERTGIKERRIAAPEQATSDLAVEAARHALEMAKLAPADVEAIIVGTVTPDHQFPSTAALVQGKLGNKKAFAFDVSAACAGSLYALTVADRFVASGAVKNALVIGADALSRITNYKDRNTCILFGDGAGAMVLRPTDDPRRGLSTIRIHTDGSLAHILLQPGGGSRDPITPEMVAAVRLHERARGLQGGGAVAGGELPRGAGGRGARRGRREVRHRPPGQQADPGRHPGAAGDPGLQVLDEPREVWQHLSGQRTDDARRGQPGRLVPAGRRHPHDGHRRRHGVGRLGAPLVR